MVTEEESQLDAQMKNVLAPPLSDEGITEEVKPRNMKKTRMEKRKRQIA